MTGMEIVISVVLFWVLTLVTISYLKSWKNSFAISGEISHLKESINLINEKHLNFVDRVLILEQSNETVIKLADETKKLLNQNTISTAFVHKNKRTELT
jgi:hypothetical protein